MKLAQTIQIKAAVDQMYRPNDYGRPLLHAPNRQRTVCVDFDGVLADSKGPYVREYIGAARPEGFKLIRMLKAEGFEVVILTARKETDLVTVWLQQHGFPGMVVTNHKIPAIAYVDDHAMHAPDDMKADDLMKKIRLAAR